MSRPSRCPPVWWSQDVRKTYRRKEGKDGSASDSASECPLSCPPGYISQGDERTRRRYKVRVLEQRFPMRQLQEGKTSNCRSLVKILLRINAGGTTIKHKLRLENTQWRYSSKNTNWVTSIVTVNGSSQITQTTVAVATKCPALARHMDVSCVPCRAESTSIPSIVILFWCLYLKSNKRFLSFSSVHRD
jgi:hypothetical protein